MLYRDFRTLQDDVSDHNERLLSQAAAERLAAAGRPQPITSHRSVTLLRHAAVAVRHPHLQLHHSHP